MLHKKYDCPLCGAKNSAMRSSYYPEIVVHKCDGKILLEVGRWDNNQVIPLAAPVAKPSFSSGNGRKIPTRNFVIEQITSVDQLMQHGNTLKNGCSVRADAVKFMGEGTIWTVFKTNSKEALYMILVKDQSIPGQQFFSGVNISPVPQNDGEEILRCLINERILRGNPFPNDYRV